MFEKSTLSYKETGVLNNLVFQYLSRNEDLKKFYGFYPDTKGFKDLLDTNTFEKTDRKTLVAAAERQAALVSNTTPVTSANIKKLGNKNSYTVTTGHQLCLFTGPLYFIYKILTTINLAEQLKKTHPDKDFIPVYWLASEDHDFEEVNHFFVSGKKIVWESGQQGAVGEMETKNLTSVKEEFAKVLGGGQNATQLISLFEESYLKHSSLSQATRFLVNALFGNYGLVTIDGNDASLKALLRDELKKDIFESIPYKYVTESVENLKRSGYSAQVNPREINCFYKDKGIRSRIEKQNDDFVVVGTDLKFSRAKLEKLIDESPEKISPNVTLRPVYQQKILPNIAYVGGPGELAYWLEYKKMFDKLEVFFPILMPRNFVTVIDKKSISKAEKLGLKVADLFRDETALSKEVQIRTSGVFELEKENEQLKALYKNISQKVERVDTTLGGNVAAELQKAIKGLESVTAKANRALKQRAETEITQLKTIRQKLFPEGIPQERFDNFSVFYLRYGQDLMNNLKSIIDPLSLQQTVLTEK
jgi:bacillithiol biosynthesis cysteine-adding enzyme BshC